MKYFYEKPDIWDVDSGKTINVNHPLFNRCTIFTQDDVGIMVVQQHFNPVTKVKWWGPVDPWLSSSIYYNSEFENYFNEHATQLDEHNLFYITSVRKLMWALRMKPLQKEFWEEDF